MTHRFAGIVAWVAVVFGGVWAEASLAETPSSRPTIDPQAEEVLRKASADLLGIKSYRVDFGMKFVMRGLGVNQNEEVAYRIGVARPKRLAIWLTEGRYGTTVVCDGKHVYTYVPAYGTYVVEDAPESIATYESPALSATGMADIIDVLVGADPYDAFVKDTIRIEYVGREALDGVDCHRLHFVEDGATADAWFQASGEYTMLLKVVVDVSERFREDFSAPAEGVKATITTSFGNWGLNRDLPDAAFTFTPPAGARKVDSFAEALGEKAEQPYALLGKQAPTFTLDVLGGGQFDLSKAKGKVVVLDFWATWCGPCRKGLPALAQLAEEFKDKPVVVVGVNQREPADTVRAFIEKNKLALTIAMDKDGKVGDAYSVSGIPHTVLIGTDGTVQASHVGFAPGMERGYRKEIDALLAGKSLIPEKDASANRNADSPDKQAKP